MKMWATFPIIMIVGILVIACQISGQNLIPTIAYPSDFQIEYVWNAGSLPPRYHYSYEIIIQADGNCKFTYQQSYAGIGAPPPSVTNFSVLPEKIDQLYQLILNKNILRTDWEKRQPSIGGSSSELQIVADGKTFSIPNDALLVDKDKTDSAEVYDFIKTLVPQNIWDDLANIRHQVDTATDSPAK
jgi:hypothetical protein